MLTDDLNRVLDAGYVGDVSALGDDELRSRRADSQAVEAKLSYLRRLVQGRLDIVSAEIERRARGVAGGDLSDLVEQLPHILADRVRAPGPGRMPTNLLPPDDDDLNAELEAAGPSLSELSNLSEAELQAVAGRLRDLERRLSDQRRAVFAVVDALQEELATRYEHGEAAGTA